MVSDWSLSALPLTIFLSFSNSSALTKELNCYYILRTSDIDGSYLISVWRSSIMFLRSTISLNIFCTCTSCVYYFSSLFIIRNSCSPSDFVNLVSTCYFISSRRFITISVILFSLLTKSSSMSLIFTCFRSSSFKKFVSYSIFFSISASNFINNFI
jgi:hypothetical protein